MKSIFDMNGTEKAAALLMLLGSETASEILKHLDEESIEKLTSEMLKMGSLPDSERDDLMGEFMIELRRAPKNATGGLSKAKKMVSDAFGEEKAAEIIDKIENRDTESSFKFFNNLNDDDIIALLKDEPPQVIALVISFIPPGKSGVLLKSLPREKSKDAAKALAKMKNPSKEAAVAVSRALKKRYDTMKKTGEPEPEGGGLNSLAAIISRMSGEQERSLLKVMDSTIPHISKEILNMTFSFENIANLTNRDTRILIDEINDDYLIARALKGSGDEIRFKFLRNMSRNRASEVLHMMDEMGAVRLKDIEKCRDMIVALMRDLNENGQISVRRDGEIYVK